MARAPKASFLSSLDTARTNRFADSAKSFSNRFAYGLLSAQTVVIPGNVFIDSNWMLEELEHGSTQAFMEREERKIVISGITRDVSLVELFETRNDNFILSSMNNVSISDLKKDNAAYKTHIGHLEKLDKKLDSLGAEKRPLDEGHPPFNERLNTRLEESLTDEWQMNPQLNSLIPLLRKANNRSEAYKVLDTHLAINPDRARQFKASLVDPAYYDPFRGRGESDQTDENWAVDTMGVHVRMAFKDERFLRKLFLECISIDPDIFTLYQDGETSKAIEAVIKFMKASGTANLDMLAEALWNAKHTPAIAKLAQKNLYEAFETLKSGRMGIEFNTEDGEDEAPKPVAPPASKESD